MMQKRSGGKAGTVRIIAGEWRGRRLPVPDLPGLRPSGDRSRETLFNWLQAFLPGKHCIDLFAGTGVLGFEAVSRGAKSAVLVEKSPIAAKSLHGHVELLAATQVTVVEGDALAWLQTQAADSAAHTADLVFVDPPFGQGLADKAIQILQDSQVLRPGGFVYLETARFEAIGLRSSVWEIVREKTLGEVQMRLLRNI